LYLDIKRTKIYVNPEIVYFGDGYIPPTDCFGYEPEEDPRIKLGEFYDISYHATEDDFEELKDRYLKTEED
jgi:hypothetical protein